MGELALETRRNTSIRNDYNEDAPLAGELIAANDLKNNYIRAQHRPTQVCYTYNCHGLTFASRRTQVYRTQCVAAILEDDGYILIQRADALPGDICIYRDDLGEISHSGMVVAVEKDFLIPRVKVLSKWGSAHEVVHYEEDCPYTPATISFHRIEK